MKKNISLITLAFISFVVATSILIITLTHIEPHASTAIYLLIVSLYSFSIITTLIWYDTKPITIYKLTYYKTDVANTFYYSNKDEAELHKRALISLSKALPKYASHYGIDYTKDDNEDINYSIFIKGPLIINSELPKLYNWDDIWNEANDTKYHNTELNKVISYKPKTDNIVNENTYENGVYDIYHVDNNQLYSRVGSVTAHSLIDAYNKAQGSEDDVIKWNILNIRSTTIGDVIKSPSSKFYRIEETYFTLIDDIY